MSETDENQPYNLEEKEPTTNSNLTQVTIVRPEWGFKDNFEQVMYTVDTENWIRTSVWEPNFIRKGIRLIHKKFGKPGKMKTRSAIVKFGFDVYYNNCKEEIELISQHYDDVINGPAMFSDQVSMVKTSPQHIRDTVGSDPEYFYIQNNLRGLIGEIGESLGLSYSEMIRHFEAICIADCVFINDPMNPAKEYEDFLFDYTRYARGPIIKSIKESMGEWREERGLY